MRDKHYIGEYGMPNDIQNTMRRGRRHRNDEKKMQAAARGVYGLLGRCVVMMHMGGVF